MAMDYSAKGDGNFAESSLEQWSHFQRHYMGTGALKMHRYNYENNAKKKKSLSGLH